MFGAVQDNRHMPYSLPTASLLPSEGSPMPSRSLRGSLHTWLMFTRLIDYIALFHLFWCADDTSCSLVAPGHLEHWSLRRIALWTPSLIPTEVGRDIDMYVSMFFFSIRSSPRITICHNFIIRCTGWSRGRANNISMSTRCSRYPMLCMSFYMYLRRDFASKTTRLGFGGKDRCLV
jgi:hypothetical protein